MTSKEGDKALRRLRATLNKQGETERFESNYTDEQDALTDLLSLRWTLEGYRDEKYPTNDGIIDEMERPSVDECLKRLQLTERAGNDPLRWTVSIDGARVLQEKMAELLPRKTKSLNQNDRYVLLAMHELGATSSENPVPAARILQAALCGYHKREWKKLREGGYVHTDGAGSSGYYLTSLGNHVVKHLIEVGKSS